MTNTAEFFSNNAVLTVAEEQIIDVLSRQDDARLMQITRETYERAANGDDDAATVNDYAMRVLMCRLSEDDFIQFCDTLN